MSRRVTAGQSQSLNPDDAYADPAATRKTTCSACSLLVNSNANRTATPAFGSSCASSISGANRRSGKLGLVKTPPDFWLMATTDWRTKNLSIFFWRAGGILMTRLADALSARPTLHTGLEQVNLRGAKLAIALKSKNAFYHLHGTHTRNWRTPPMQNDMPCTFKQMVKPLLQVSGAPEMKRL